jgi:hypothetical protein
MGFYVLAAFVTWLLSLGPAPTVMGSPLMHRGPYALLMALPGFNTLRVPARFWMTTILCLAMIGAMVFDRLAARFGRMRAIAAAVIAVGIVADTWMAAMPLARLPEPLHVAGCRPGASGALLELPVGDPYHDVAAMPPDVPPASAGERIQRVLSAALRGPAVRCGAARSRRADAAGRAWRYRCRRPSR